MDVGDTDPQPICSSPKKIIPGTQNLLCYFVIEDVSYNFFLSQCSLHLPLCKLWKFSVIIVVLQVLIKSNFP